MLVQRFAMKSKRGDAIRIKTPEGWKPAELVGRANAPRSYMSSRAGNSGRLYRRNAKGLMKTGEDDT